MLGAFDQLGKKEIYSIRTQTYVLGKVFKGGEILIKDLINIAKQLEPEERKQLEKGLKKESNDEFLMLLTEVKAKYQTDPISDKEIINAVEAIL